jgi:hypothetical protein
VTLSPKTSTYGVGLEDGLVGVGVVVGVDEGGGGLGVDVGGFGVDVGGFGVDVGGFGVVVGVVVGVGVGGLGSVSIKYLYKAPSCYSPLV